MRPRRQREPSSVELDLWAHATRDVRPIGARSAVVEVTAPPAEPPPPVIAAPATTAVPARPLSPPLAPQKLDRHSRQRLLRGQMVISARLDLHGLDQQAAHAALDGFIALEHGRGARCVLVITGFGIRSGGVLRQLTPRWLETGSIAGRVLAYGPAQTRHGGAGALYVLLRRRRSA